MFSLLLFTSSCPLIHFLNPGSLGPSLCLFLGYFLPRDSDVSDCSFVFSCLLSRQGRGDSISTAQRCLVPGSLGCSLDINCFISNLLLSCLCPQQKRGRWQFSADCCHGYFSAMQEKMETCMLYVSWSPDYLEIAAAWHDVDQDLLLIWWWAFLCFLFCQGYLLGGCRLSKTLVFLWRTSLIYHRFHSHFQQVAGDLVGRARKQGSWPTEDLALSRSTIKQQGAIVPNTMSLWKYSPED